MARLPDFDGQWEHSHRNARAKADRGQGAWAIDKALERNTTGHTPQPGPKHAKPSGDSCVTALALLGGAAWALTEAIRYVA